MKGIKESKIWSWSDVRSLCIRNDWYTYGTCNQYAVLQNLVETHKPTTKNLYDAAEDIYYHSEMCYRSDYTKEENLENIMFQLMEDTVHTFFSIETEEV